MSAETTNDDPQRFASIISELSKQIVDFKNYVDNLSSGVRKRDVEKDKGISLLELKCHLMLNYLTNLSYLSLKKMERKSIRGDDAVFRLAETRTILERMRPIEQKLQYQIDKLIKAVNAPGGGSKDALSFRPNPGALVSTAQGDESDANEDEEMEDEEKRASSKKYVPPKLVAMPYNEDGERVNQASEKARKRALSSSLIRDLQEQYGHGPEEITDIDHARRRDMTKQKEKTRYEEDNFVRLQVTKAQKQAAKRVSAKSTLQSLLDFGDYGMEEASEPKKRKRPVGSSSKSKGRGKSKGKGKGKRR